MGATHDFLTDALYGEMSFPPFILDLVASTPFQRLRDISQGEGPREVIAWQPPSRFEHSLGVAYLMQCVLEQNPGLEGRHNLLLASALLHDTGNPPFSHTAEPYLKHLYAFDGESFVAEMVQGSEIPAILSSAGVALADLVKVVTGSMTPLSKILHGSIDVDNLDNVLRYALCHDGPGALTFDSRLVARGFRWDGQDWLFNTRVAADVRAWQEARTKVYNNIYSGEKLAVYWMLHRAIYSALREGALTREFFSLNDSQALSFLEEASHGGARIVERLRSRKLYQLILSQDVPTNHPGIRSVRGNPLALMELTDQIAAILDLPNEDLNVAVVGGREHRPIAVRWTDPSFHFEDTHQSPTPARVRVLSRHDTPELRERVAVRVRQLLDLPSSESVGSDAIFVQA